MKRIVGLSGKNKVSREKPPQPGLNDIVQSTNRRADVVESQIAQCDAELRKISQLMRNLPPGVSRLSLQTKAKGILTRKKRYEQQVENLREKSFNVDSLATNISVAEEIQIVAGVMKSGTKDLKKQLKKVNLDTVEDFQAELSDLLDLTDDVQAAMTRNYEVPADIDDDELSAQLDMLGDEIVLDNDPSYIDAVLRPSGSATLTSDNGRAPKGPPGAMQAQVDEFGLPILDMSSLTEPGSTTAQVPGGSQPSTSTHPSNLNLP